MTLADIMLKYMVDHMLINERKGVVSVAIPGGPVVMARCSPDDGFDPEVGAALAIARALAGSKTQFRKAIAGARRITGSKPTRPAAEPTKPIYLRSILADRNTTPIEVAAIAGVSATTVRRACNGYWVNSKTFAKIRDALGMTERESDGVKASFNKRQKDYRL